MHKVFAILFLVLRGLEARNSDLCFGSFEGLVLRFSFFIAVPYIVSFSRDLFDELRSKKWLAIFLFYTGLTVVFNSYILFLFPLYLQLLADVFVGLVLLAKLKRPDFVLKVIYFIGAASLIIASIYQQRVYEEDVILLEVVRNHEQDTSRVFGMFGDSFPFFLILIGIKYFSDNKLWMVGALSFSGFANSVGALLLGVGFLICYFLKVKIADNLFLPFVVTVIYILSLVFMFDIYEGGKVQALALRHDTILFALKQIDLETLIYSGYGMFSFIDKPEGIFGNVTNQFVQILFDLGIIGFVLALFVFEEARDKGSNLLSKWVFLGIVSFTWFLPGYFIIALIILIYGKKGSAFYNHN